MDSTLNAEDLVTDLSQQLNAQEYALLAKGPKFAIGKEWNATLKTDVQTNFCKMAYQLRWKSQRQARTEDNETRCTIPRYPESNFIHLPPRDDQELEIKLKRSYAELEKLMEEIERKKPPSNISKREKETLDQLKKKNIICLPSDKGGEFCIIRKEEHDKAAYQHLNEGTTYKKVPRMQAKTIETKINNTWKSVLTNSSQRIYPRAI